jgi:hypothetical protein
MAISMLTQKVYRRDRELQIPWAGIIAARAAGARLQ